MQAFFHAINDFIQTYLKILGDHLAQLTPDASAIILGIIAVGLLGLLMIIAWRLIPGEKHSVVERKLPPDIDDIEGSARLKKMVRDLTAENEEYAQKIRNTRLNPDHTKIEKLYFGVNGITNSGFLLSIGLILWEFFNLRGRAGSIPVAEIIDELGRLMSVLALTMVFSSIVVFIAWPEKGKSYEKINKAFFISLMFTFAALIVFVFMAKHMP